MRIAIVGDAFFPAEALAAPIRALEAGDELSLADVGPEMDVSRPHPGIREYVGGARDVAAILDGHQALVVHAAAVTAEVLDAAPGLALVCCARGGPVNVDVRAAAQRGIPVVTAPGKNAHAVAELTMAFLVMLARRIPSASEILERDGRMGDSVIEGAAFMGTELRDRRLGIVGYGHVGGLVAGLARSAGMEVVAFDPNVSPEAIAEDGVTPVEVDALLAASDFVSLHARATAANENMIGARELAVMQRTAYLVNTARETLVDEAALARALTEGTIAGAALDVLRPAADGGRHPLLGLPGVIATPHIGGATFETLQRGATMIADEIQRFRTGQPLVNVVPAEGAVTQSQEGVA